MYLKVMGDNDSYTLHECKSVQFYRSQSEKGETVFNPRSINSTAQLRPFAMLDHDGDNGKIVPITGPTYVLNSDGKTVDRFSEWITDPSGGVIPKCASGQASSIAGPHPAQTIGSGLMR